MNKSIEKAFDRLFCTFGAKNGKINMMASIQKKKKQKKNERMSRRIKKIGNEKAIFRLD